MGTDPIALPLLEALFSVPRGELEFIGLFTQPDRRAGRGMKWRRNPIKSWATERDIPLLQADKLSDGELEWLRSRNCNLIVVMGYGKILSTALLDIPSRGTINFHASLLPAYRGASPIEGAIAAGETVTGVSLMRVVRRMDAGPVLDRAKVEIEEGDNCRSVREKIARICPSLLRKHLPLIRSGKANFKPQEESAAVYTRLLVKSDANLDFQYPARVLVDRIRALHLWPGSFLEIAGVKYKIGSATARESIPPSAPPGTLFPRKNSLAVATGGGILEVLKLQRPGGRMLPIDAFLRGCPVSEDQVATSRAMKPLSAARPFKYPV